MADEPQTYANHARFVPPYHYVAFPILIANAVWAIIGLVRAPSTATAFGLLLAVALVIIALYSRVFALTAQDRVIRLEMRLRLERLLPAADHARIDDLTTDQAVSLRFAGDAELPALFRQVLDERITSRKQIKLLIKDWKADHLRV